MHAGLATSWVVRTARFCQQFLLKLGLHHRALQLVCRPAAQPAQAPAHVHNADAPHGGGVPAESGAQGTPRKWGVLKAARKVLWTKAPEPEKSKPSVHWDTVETPSTSATAQGTDSAMVRTPGLLLPCSMLRACWLSLAAGPKLAASGLYLGCAAA